MDTKKCWNAFLVVGSMVLFFVVLWMVLSWERALIISGSVFFHEYGHIFAMQRYGMKVKGMYFIPFLGGAAVPASRMPSQQSDVVISLAGPVFGLLLAIATAIAYVATGWSILGVAVIFMALLNVFNLLPVFPLDGGRVLSCIAHSVDARIGTLLMGGSLILSLMLFWFTGQLLLLLIVFFAFTALRDYLNGRPARRRMLESLEMTRTMLADGRQMDLSSRAYLAMRLGVPGWEDGPLRFDAPPPSTEELQKRLEEALANLREHPPLPPRWIFFAVGGWMTVVAMFLSLATILTLDPKVLEGFLTFFRPG